MSNDTIYFNKKEALRYFRAQPGDAQAGAAIDVAYEKLRNELQPRYTVKRFGCRADAESVWLDNSTVFRSKALARYVGEATELFLFGATLGSRVDIALRRMALTSVAEAGAGQAVAAALIETYCDDCCGAGGTENFVPGTGLCPHYRSHIDGKLHDGAGEICDGGDGNYGRCNTGKS